MFAVFPGAHGQRQSQRLCIPNRAPGDRLSCRLRSTLESNSIVLDYDNAPRDVHTERKLWHCILAFMRVPLLHLNSATHSWNAPSRHYTGNSSTGTRLCTATPACILYCCRQTKALAVLLDETLSLYLDRGEHKESLYLAPFGYSPSSSFKTFISGPRH